MSNNTLTTLPSPFSFAPSQRFDGIDGSWSSFIVRVGTPEQAFRILPSTTGQETWVPVPEACREGTDPDNCGDLRGGYPDSEGNFGYNFNKSSTWKNIGIFGLDLREELNQTGAGQFGFDTVGLQIQNSGGFTLKNQVVAGIRSQKWFNGIFGLGVKPSNFSGFDFPQPSFMRTLWDEKQIPSLSWSYTAGAAYKIPKVAGSLTLGGYDSSRFKPPTGNASFPFDQNDSRSLSLGIQSISASGSLTGAVTLMRSAIVSLIDSSVSHIWLPKAVCDQFESSFGLSYDNRTGFYRVNDTMHSKLQEINPTITFTLGNNNDPSKAVNIELPYAAFDLQVGWPIYKNTSYYFPIRRADNDTMFTLGRTFLQEAMVVADYERQNFSVYQARFDTAATQPNIVPIVSPTLEYLQQNSSTTQQSQASTSRKLSTGAIAGISIGSVVIAALIFTLVFIFLRRRQRSKQPEAPPVPEKDPRVHELFQEFGEVIGSKVQYEIDSKNLYMMAGHDVGDHKAGAIRYAHEMPSATDDRPMYFEMPTNETKSVRGSTTAQLKSEKDGTESTKGDGTGAKLTGYSKHGLPKWI